MSERNGLHDHQWMSILLAQVYLIVWQCAAEMLLQQVSEHGQEASLGVRMPA